MKTFKDLSFGPHTVGDGFQAYLDFENGYGISVVRFSIRGLMASYTDGDEWEAAIFHDGSICYDTPITGDVIGHLTDDEVTKLMEEIQKLPKLTVPRNLSHNHSDDNAQNSSHG